MPSLQISYSNTIFCLKLILFFLGLFAIVLIFWSAKKIEPSAEIPFAEDVDFTSLNDGLTQPSYSSITNSGDEIQIAARQIIQTKNKDAVLIKSADLKVFSENGSDISLSSDNGLFNKEEKNLIFTENVLLKTDDHIQVTAPQISSFLDKTITQAGGPVLGLFAGGHIEAGQLNISRENISSNLVISFTKGVKMLYTPINN